MKRSSRFVAVVLVGFCLMAFGSTLHEDDAYWPDEVAFQTRKWQGGALTLSNAFPYNEQTSVFDHWVRSAPRIATGDFDEDGNMDLVLPLVFGHIGESLFRRTFVGTWPTCLAIGFGDGKGSIRSVIRLLEDVDREAVTAADVDEDGHLDILVRIYGEPVGSRYPDERLHILFGDGSGEFPVTVVLTTDGFESCGGWRVADMNGDSHLDLVSVGLLSRDGEPPVAGSCIVPGNGNRVFDIPKPSSFGFIGDTHPSRFELCDVNRDGSPDLVASVVDFERNQSEEDVETRYFESQSLGAFDRVLVVCQNNGSGLLTVASEKKLDSWPLDLVVGDVNGDGNVDIAVSTGASNHMANQAWERHTEIVGRKWGIVVRDGEWAPCPQEEVRVDSISVLLGDGSGDLAEPQHWATGLVAPLLRTADLNGDALDDIICFSLYGRVFVYEGSAETTLDGPHVYSSATAPHNPNWTAALADVNGDAIVDFVVPSLTASLLVRFGNGDGGFNLPWFAPPIESEVPYSPYLRGSPVDFDRDGNLDILGYNDGRMMCWFWIAYGDGTGAFPRVSEFGPPAGFEDYQDGPYFEEMAVGDLDGNGWIDILLFLRLRSEEGNWEYISHLYRNNEGEDLLAECGLCSFDLPGRPAEVSVADINEDGYDDVFISYYNNPPELLLGSRTGQMERTGVAFDQAYSVQVETLLNHQIADFNEDGVPDLIADCLDSHFLVILAGDAQGMMTEVLRFGKSELLLGIGDLNEDGHLDVYANRIHLGNGDGTFMDPIEESEFMGIPATDFNHDGHLDYVIDKLGVTRIALGDGHCGIAVEEHFATSWEDSPTSGEDIYGDFNNDGWDDIVVHAGDRLNCILNRFVYLREDLE